MFENHVCDDHVFGDKKFFNMVRFIYQNLQNKENKLEKSFSLKTAFFSN